MNDMNSLCMNLFYRAAAALIAVTVALCLAGVLSTGDETVGVSSRFPVALSCGVVMSMCGGDENERRI